jgi:hypothetical protein
MKELEKKNINMKLQEQINRIQSMMGIVSEVRVPRDERVELYKDDNIIVVVPLTHSALRKYANSCQWCINNDLGEWEDYHKGKHAVIIQRNPKKENIGITGNPTASELLMYERWGEGYTFDDIESILGYEFKNQEQAEEYLGSLTKNIDNFATNILYYSPEYGLYDMEDNRLQTYGYRIDDMPNVTPEVIEIMDNYLTKEE